MSQNQLAFGKIQVIDKALPESLFQELQQTMAQVGWRFGWNTPSNPNTRYWHHEIGHGRKENVLDISEKVKQHPLPVFAKFQDWLRENLVGHDTKILRFYMNAHTFGTDGWPHTDTDRTGEQTAILYLNDEWKPEFCGETVIFNQHGDILVSVLPKPNRILAFPANLLHAPRPLSKEYAGLRVVLVVKMALADAQIEANKTELLAP